MTISILLQSRDITVLCARIYNGILAEITLFQLRWQFFSRKKHFFGKVKIFSIFNASETPKNGKIVRIGPISRKRHLGMFHSPPPQRSLSPTGFIYNSIIYPGFSIQYIILHYSTSLMMADNQPKNADETPMELCLLLRFTPGFMSFAA